MTDKQDKRDKQPETKLPVAETKLPVAETNGPVIETKRYSDGSSATGVAPLPDQSPEQQAKELTPTRAEHRLMFEAVVVGVPELAATGVKYGAATAIVPEPYNGKPNIAASGHWYDFLKALW